MALSVLLGRVYFQSYLQTLGIPISDVNIHILDYSIIAPRVTIMGVGIAVGVPSVFLALMFSPSTRSRNWRMVLTGLVAAVLIWGGLRFFPIPPESQAFGSGVRAIAEALLITLMLGSSAIVGKGLGRVESTTDSSDSDEAAASLTYQSILRALLPLLVVFIILIQTLVYASESGTVDANATKSEAPEARINFRESASQRISGVCSNQSDECAFRVILIGDDFIYLIPAASNASPDLHALYAFPISDIQHIAYNH